MADNGGGVVLIARLLLLTNSSSQKYIVLSNNTHTHTHTHGRTHAKISEAQAYESNTCYYTRQSGRIVYSCQSNKPDKEDREHARTSTKYENEHKDDRYCQHAQTDDEVTEYTSPHIKADNEDIGYTYRHTREGDGHIHL